MQEFISYNIATMVVKRTGIYQHRENDRSGEPYTAHIVRFYCRLGNRRLLLFYMEHKEQQKSNP